ncbi:hypothetical protein brsh051_25060 [Brooklawnia propionicigenes]|uniref:Plasmid pRiA4b Orf3-like domain-containing protein n=1 Tax=Brooklawnia propionicigenes TaxID=3041175 RepID=A0AAN0KJE2_9ACTN|nr:plasmid pRiA4b ORF-3 family protein [Brooklawnia sp. SH051]BEH03225.1 hypothetical protein brsh051_25060 [Brooklawnia sp. SH051]
MASTYWADPDGFALTTPTPLGRRAVKAALIVRLDLDDAHPPIWRQLRLASDLTLPQVHEVVQIAMGWTDSHLHHFVMGPDTHDPTTQHFLTPFDIAEGDKGIPESDVHLDQVISEPGDCLFYEYDFGDSWWHTMKLESVEPWRAGDTDAWCLAGQRACPPEDLGGIGGLEELLNWLDGRTEGADPEWVQQVLDWLPPGYDPVAFSVDEVNAVLARGLLPPLEQFHPMVSILMRNAGGSPLSDLGELIRRADLGSPSLTERDMADAVRGYQVLLAEIGDGLTLTQAGYLPPRVVQQILAELGPETEWVGIGTREDTSQTVSSLRRSATALGLVRLSRGRLTVTSNGRRLAGDPPHLLRHIATRLPLGKQHEQDAGTIALLFVAAGKDWLHSFDEAARIMEWIGWRTGGDAFLDERAVHIWSKPTRDVLQNLGGSGLSTPNRQIAVARYLLQTADQR